jgi:hypothetical protein
MLRTVEEAMSQVIDWWGDLPPPMKEAIEQFRTQLGAAIDSVYFVNLTESEGRSRLWLRIRYLGEIHMSAEELRWVSNRKWMVHLDLRLLSNN